MKNATGVERDIDSDDAIEYSSQYREFGGEQAFMSFQREVNALKQDSPTSHLYHLKASYWLLPWEFQRMLKVGQRRAQELYDLDQIKVGMSFGGNDYQVDQMRMRQIFDSQQFKSLKFLPKKIA